MDKDLVMAIGLTAQLAAAWQMVRPITSSAWVWLLLPALVMLTHVSLQDMRDIAGDRANRRRTFPIIFGERPSRIFLAVSFALLPLATHFALMAPAGATAPVIVCDILLAAISLTIAARLLALDTPQAHHRSYMLFTYWYCFLLASAIIVL